MFYIVYYGIIGKQCFTLRWHFVSYMEIAPLPPPPSTKWLEVKLHFRNSSMFHSIFILGHIIGSLQLSLFGLSGYSGINVHNVLSLIRDDAREVFVLHKCLHHY